MDGDKLMREMHEVMMDCTSFPEHQVYPESAIFVNPVFV